MRRLIVQTKRRYKTNKEKGTQEKSTIGIGEQKESDSHCATDEETGEGSGQRSNGDQDSDVSFHDEDEEIDKFEEEEEWTEFIKRSTKEAEEHMKKTNMPWWIETHRRMKWRMAMRIASLPQERRTSKITEWNPGLDNKIKTNRSVGRPRKRWEDEINEQLREEETAEAKGSDLKNYDTRKNHAQNHKRMEEKRRNIRKVDSSKPGG